jgi:hypothetical protein
MPFLEFAELFSRRKAVMSDLPKDEPRPPQPVPPPEPEPEEEEEDHPAPRRPR